MTAQYLNEQRLVRRKFDLMLQAYSIVGVLVALFAVGYLVLTFLPFELSVQQQMASAFVGVGIALALTSRILILFRKEREAAELERLKEYEHIATFLEV